MGPVALACVGEVLLWVAVLGLGELLAKLRHDLDGVVGGEDDRATLRALNLRGFLRDDLRGLETVLRLRVLWLAGVWLLLLLQEVIVHLVLHFCALLGAAQGVRLSRGADGVVSL